MKKNKILAGLSALVSSTKYSVWFYANNSAHCFCANRQEINI